MTDAQKETLKFYTTNDYLLINGLLWNEDQDTIEAFIQLINQDGRGVMEEAQVLGPDVRWNCSMEEGLKLLQIYQKRFPVIDSDEIRKEILSRARQDIRNMMDCMKPLRDEMILYRNVKTQFTADIAEDSKLNWLGFSSCSLNPHSAENAMYGSSNCTMFEIVVPAETHAIRLDLYKDVQNEPDEVILPPMEFVVTKIDKENHVIYMRCGEMLRVEV